MLDSRLVRLRKDSFPIDDAAANFGHFGERIAQILSARSRGLRNLFQIFDVNQREAARACADYRLPARVLAPDANPAKVQLHLH